MFHIRNKSSKRRSQSWCKDCRRIYDKERHKRYKVKRLKLNEDAIVSQREFIWNYLLNNPCSSCGETDPLVLDFDHLDSKSKSFNVSSAGQTRYSLNTLEVEIKKCQVLCSNCHRRKTAKDLNWWSYKYSLSGYS